MLKSWNKPSETDNIDLALKSQLTARSNCCGKQKKAKFEIYNKWN